MNAKTCAACRLSKYEDQFPRQGARGRHSYCKACYNARYRGARRRATPPEVRRAQNFKSRYGLTPEDVEAMVQRQGGVCAICTEILEDPCVDHDHSTGKVRGILCHRCNLGLGLIEDERFRAAAIAYLEAHR